MKSSERLDGRRGWVTGAARALAGLLFAGVVNAGAATDPVAGSVASGTGAAVAAAAPLAVETKADRLNYEKQTGWIDGRGHVHVRYGDQQVFADSVRVNVETGDVIAEGNVVLLRAGEEWKGPLLRYNFKTRAGDAGPMQGATGPFRVVSEGSRKAGNEYVFEKASVTTCTNEPGHLHYRVAAREVLLYPGDRIRLNGPTWYLGPVPIFYLPFISKSLDGETGFSFAAGRDYSWGMFLLSGYRWRLNPWLKTRTRVDYRTKRGWAVGQDFMWDWEDVSNGDLELYLANDQNPYDEGDEDADIESTRYRILLDEQYTISERDYVLAHAEYVSDIDLREDFFEDDFDMATDPDNFLQYAHGEPDYALGVLARFRLNDFYSSVSYLPELYADFLQREVAESGIYYEGRTTAANILREFEEGSDEEDYSVLRFDTYNRFSYPGKYFGFLQVVPRAAYRGTHYSKTREERERIEIFNRVTTNLVVSGGRTNQVLSTRTVTNEVTDVVDGPSALRSIFEVGVFQSFKAFSTWMSDDGDRRHIVEPYADYSFIPEPNITADELYQFDGIDALGKQHAFTPGVRNKYQKKVDGAAFDLADVNLYTVINLDTEEDQDAISAFYLDGDFRPMDDILWEADAVYSTGDDAGISTFNTRITIPMDSGWALSGEYRYRREDSSLLAGTLSLRPFRDWQFDLFGRYEFEEDRIEEDGLAIQRELDCLTFRGIYRMLPGYERSDGREVEDEWRVALEMWMNAFPKFGFGVGHGT